MATAGGPRNIGFVLIKVCLPFEVKGCIFLFDCASSICFDGLIATILDSGEPWNGAIGCFYFKKFEQRLNLSFVISIVSCSLMPWIPSWELRGTKIFGSVFLLGEVDFYFQSGEAEAEQFPPDWWFSVRGVSLDDEDFDESIDLLNLKWLV